MTFDRIWRNRLCAAFLVGATAAGCASPRQLVDLHEYGIREAQGAARNMERSSFYGEIHRIRETAEGKRSAILLEQSSAAWGGYEAILLIETANGVLCYSHLPVQSKDREIQEQPMDRHAYAKLLQAMVEQGLWDVQDYFDSPVMDGTTYFLTVANDQREKRLTVHAPVFAERVDPALMEAQEATRVHAKIIKLIQDFAAGSSWGLEPAVQQEMIRLAREKAAESKISVEDCAVTVVREAQSGSWAVEFRPVRRDQFGGGGKFWFKVEGDKITFEKMGRWE